MEFTKSGGIRLPIKVAFFETLGYLASKERMTKLDAELPNSSQNAFERDYKNLTQIVPIPDNNNYYILHSNADKWGVELRIYFVSNDKLPLHLRSRMVNSRPTDIYNARINDNEFIWKLIRYGFRLDDEQDIDLITSKVPETYMEDFQKGLSL